MMAKPGNKTMPLDHNKKSERLLVVGLTITKSCGLKRA